MKKSPLSVEKLRKTIAALKPIGLINYSLSELKNLSPQQKGSITRKYNKLRHFVDHPKEFTIKKTTTKTGKKFKAAGYVTSKTNRVLIPLKGNDSATFRGDQIKFKKGKRTETVYLSGDVKEMAKNIKKATAKKGGLVGFKIGENAIASTQFTNVKDLNNYLTNVMHPKFNTTKDKFKALVSLVQFDDAYIDYGETPDNGRKNAKKTSTKKAAKKNRGNRL